MFWFSGKTEEKQYHINYLGRDKKDLFSEIMDCDDMSFDLFSFIGFSLEQSSS